MSQEQGSTALIRGPRRAFLRDRLFAASALALSDLHFATRFDPKLSIYTDIRNFVYFAWEFRNSNLSEDEHPS
jgi:hypothetical protein